MPLLRKRRAEALSPEGGFTAGWEVPGHFNFTRDVVDALAEDPNRGALTFVDTEGIVDRRTFAEISGDAARWAHLLRTRLERGDRVLVLLGKSPAWHCAMLGALKGGLVAVPCPDMLRARDIAFRVRHSGARLVIAERACETEVEEMRNQLEGSVAVLYLDEAKSELSRYMPVAPTEDTTAGETALILYTSGTTKDPKGVVHTHAYTWAKRMQASHWLGAHEKDVVWCTANTGWAKAIWNVLLGPWSFGAEIVVHEGAFEPEQRLSLMQKLGVTILCQAPTEYRMLAKVDSLDTAYLPRLRHAVSAGEPLNPEVIERFRSALGLTIYDGYGQTENTLLVANTPDMPIRPGSMGLPTPGHDIAVIDEAGHVCAPGEEGDLALIGRPPTLFTGYWEAPDDTDAAFRDGWYITGDRAVRDEDGYLWFVGRADDVILSAAYRIGPFEVESALLEHPAVAESAVVGVPDEDRGQIVKAFVVLRPGHEGSDALAAELQSHVKAVTAPYKYPRAISFVDELPKTSSGKIRRVDLRENPDIGSESIPTDAHIGAAAPDAVDDAAAAEAAARAVEQRRAEAEAARQRLAAELAAHRQAATVASESTQLAAAEAALQEAQEAEEAEEARARAAAEERERIETEERARAEAEETARREAEEAQARAAAEERERIEAEERARAEAEETARREAEEAQARAAAEERERIEAEERARAEAEETARREAEEAQARAAAEERERIEAEEAQTRAAAEEHARAEAEAEARELAEAARALAEEAERERLEAEARARAAAEEDETRRRAEEAELADRRLAAWQAAQVVASERVQDDLARIDELAGSGSGESDELDAIGDDEEDDAKPGWREARRAKKEEAAREKQAAKDAEQRAKEEAEQRKRDEAAAKERAKEEAEQRKRDEAAAKERAKEEAEQRKRDEAAAKERAKEEAEQRKRDEAAAKERAKEEAEQRKRDEAPRGARQGRGRAAQARRGRREQFEAEQRKLDEANARAEARRRETEAKEAAKRQAEEEKEAARRRSIEEKEEAKRRAEEERRLKKLQSKTKGRGQLYDLPEEEVDPVEGAPASIPGIVDRLQQYSNMPRQPGPVAPEDDDAPETER